MSHKSINIKHLTAVFLLATGLISVNAVVAEDIKVAFPDRYMFRLGSYFVDQATTDFTILSNAGIGGGVSFKDDLGGEDTDTIPRIDAYYRFNNKHRIDFTLFTVDRPGSKTLTVDLTIGDETFFANDTIVSDIKYNVYKLDYAYSFYHSPEVELSLLAGLSFTSYDLSYSLDSGGRADSSDVTAPLPMFGLSMGYAINSNWSLHYTSESFFIELNDSIKGALLNYQLDIEYKLFQNFSIGLGVSRFSTDVEIKNGDWKGSIQDSRRGVLLFGALYF